MGFLKHIFRRKNKQQLQEVVQDNKQEQLNQSKIYLDEDMADDIVNILNNINKQQ